MKTKKEPKQYSLGKLIIIILFIFFIYSLVNKPSSSLDSSIGKTHKDFAQALIKKEPKVKDAMWASLTLLKVGVLDDGSNRKGFASYICEKTAEAGLNTVGLRVKVIDISKLVHSNTEIELGKVNC